MLIILLMSENSLVEGTVFVTTPPVNGTARHLPIKLVLNDRNRTRIDTGRTFRYHSSEMACP